MNGDLAATDPAEDITQGRQVEDVREDLAIGLDEDREAAVARGDGEQIGGSLALLPQRRPGARPATRQEERPSGVLPEPAGEQGAAGHLADDQVLQLIRIGKEERFEHARGDLAVRQPDRDPVVGPDRLDLGPEPLADPGLQRERPRRMDPATEWRQQDEPPVTELVAESLDDDPPIGRQRADHLALVLEVGDEIFGRELVEIVIGPKPGQDRRPSAGTPRELVLGLANERPERPPQLDRPADGVAMPERQLARHTRRRRNRDPVVGDLLDPPARRAEGDDLADAALVDHLLVELADPPPGRPGLADHEDAVQPAVRDRAAARHGDDPGVSPARDDVGLAVPRPAA